MNVPALLGASDATLGVALAVAWALALGVGLYQYRQGTRSRERVSLLVASGAFWLAYSLLQIATTLSKTGQRAVAALAVGLFCAGIGAGIRWWRVRNAETSATGQV